MNRLSVFWKRTKRGVSEILSLISRDYGADKNWRFLLTKLERRSAGMAFAASISRRHTIRALNLRLPVHSSASCTAKCTVRNDNRVTKRESSDTSTHGGLR